MIGIVLLQCTSLEQFIVMCHQLFGNGLTVYQL